MTSFVSVHTPLVQERGTPGASTEAAFAGCPKVGQESEEVEAIVHPPFVSVKRTESTDLERAWAATLGLRFALCSPSMSLSSVKCPAPSP